MFCACKCKLYWVGTGACGVAELCCNSSSLKGMMGWLSKECNKGVGVSVHVIGVLTCRYSSCVALLSCIVCSTVSCVARAGLMPVMRLCIFSMASNSSGCVSGCLFVVLSRFLKALAMRLTVLMVGGGREWLRKANVLVLRTGPLSVTALMHQ